MARFFVSNFFIIILFVFSFIHYNKIKNTLRSKHLYLLILGLLIWSQPILGGPIFTGGNIQRLTTFSIPVFLLLFSYIYKNTKLKNFNFYIAFVLLILSSFDHNYSVLGRFEIFTNSNYLQSIIFIFISLNIVLKNKFLKKLN